VLSLAFSSEEGFLSDQGKPVQAARVFITNVSDALKSFGVASAGVNAQGHADDDQNDD
jgi:hypothetical protein